MASRRSNNTGHQQAAEADRAEQVLRIARRVVAGGRTLGPANGQRPSTVALTVQSVEPSLRGEVAKAVARLQAKRAGNQ